LVGIFTRDPGRYLAGVNVSHAELENVEMRRYALYFGRFTLAALAGFQDLD